MKARTHKTFPLFEMVLVIALGLIGWVAYRLYEITPENDENRKQFAGLKIEYFQISETVQSNLNELDGIFTNYLQSKDTGEMELFQTRCREFQQWLEKETLRWKPLANPSLDSTEARANGTNQAPQIQTQILRLLSAIEVPFRNYQHAALYLMNNAGKPLVKERISQREQALQRSKSRLLALARQARMRGETTELFLSGTQERHGTMNALFQNLRFALLLVLVGLSFLLMLAIYRRRLSQTRRISQISEDQHLEERAHAAGLAGC